MAKAPLYITFAETLMAQIETGELRAGDRLPSERTLANTHHINRQTVRRGLAILINRGLLEKSPNRGTFIAHAKLERNASEFLDFAERIKQQGYTPGSTVMALQRIKASEKTAGDLALSPGAEVFQIHRLRTINGAPVLLETFSTPADLVPQIEQFDLNQRSFYEVLRSEYQIEISHSQQSLEAVALSDIEAQWLHTEPGAPAMLERRLSFDQNDRPIESGTDLYRGDRVRFNTAAKMSISIADS